MRLEDMRTAEWQQTIWPPEPIDDSLTINTAAASNRASNSGVHDGDCNQHHRTTRAPFPGVYLGFSLGTVFGRGVAPGPTTVPLPGNPTQRPRGLWDCAEWQVAAKHPKVHPL